MVVATVMIVGGGTTMSRSFRQARLPRTIFGAGVLGELPEVIAGYGDRALVVTGGSSLDASGTWETLAAGLAAAGICVARERAAGEPTPELVDAVVAAHRAFAPQVVVGIGGGSAV